MRWFTRRIWRRAVALWQTYCILTWWGPSDIVVAVNVVRCPCRGRCGNIAVEAVLSIEVNKCHMLIPSGRLASRGEVHRQLDESGAALWKAICEKRTSTPEPIAGRILESG